MSVKVAINGFGRIGRNILRSAIENCRKDIEIVAINDLAPVETNAHLLKYDSVHGKFPGAILINGNIIDAGDGPIRVTNLRNPEDLPWGDVDIVLECTGIFTSKEQASIHLKSGARRVLVSAPSSGADRTIAYGVNHNTLGSDDVIVSNASCTTNCMAPVAKVLDETVGIKKGFMTTIHSYTGDQPTLDRGHSDLYRARAAALNMIPTSTGAARAVGLVLPQLEGKLDGVSIRVPTPNVSCVDLTFEAAQGIRFSRAFVPFPVCLRLRLKTDYICSVFLNLDHQQISAHNESGGLYKHDYQIELGIKLLDKFYFQHSLICRGRSCLL